MNQLDLIKKQSIIFSTHAKQRLDQRSINKSSVEVVVLNGTPKTSNNNSGETLKYSVPRSKLVDLEWNRKVNDGSLSEIRNLKVITAVYGNKQLIVTAFRDEESLEQFDARRGSEVKRLLNKN